MAATCQPEVKRYLVEHQFAPADGWDLIVDVDAMIRLPSLSSLLFLVRHPRHRGEAVFRANS